MKILLFVLALIAAAPLVLFAQNPPAPPYIYQMGNRQVRVPAPDGFDDITLKFTDATARMRAAEAPGTDLLAVHVPYTFVPKLQASQDIDLEFYTKVSVNQRARTTDINADLYAAIVADLEKNFGTYIDPNGPLIKGSEKSASKGLTELLGSETTVNVSGVKNLGFIEKSDKVFSGVILVSIEVYGRKVTTLGTFSLIHVNQRAIVAAAYRMSPNANSIRELTDLTKKWTAKIIAANK